MKVAWTEAEGRIVGWGGEEDLTVKVTMSRVTKSFRFSRDDLPPGRWQQCLDTLGEDNPDKAVERICSDFRPQLFVPYAELEGSLPADAWQLREAFLRVTPDSGSILAFLNRWGRWTYQGYVQLRKIVRFQEIVRRALVSPPDEWFEELYSDLDPMDRKAEYPYFTMETAECEPAICLTVTIDLLRQVKFETCARPDCAQPFPIASRHKRKYCTQYCGHLESVRRSRAKSKEAEV